MKTKDDWKKEIDKLLAEKIASVVKEFQENRSILLDELTTLGDQLDALEKRAKDLSAEKGKLNRLINADLARIGEIDRLGPRRAKQTKAAQARINEIVQTLTTLPAGIEGWLLTQLQVRKGG